MATLPADEDYARAVLSIFGAKALRTGQSQTVRQLRIAFAAKNMGGEAELDAALDYSIDQGWLTLELGAVRLTRSGFEEA